jgi:hypothetical protein
VGKNISKKFVKQNEMCAVPWPFYPKVLQFKRQLNKDFSFFFPLSSHNSVTVDPVTVTMYIGI